MCMCITIIASLNISDNFATDIPISNTHIQQQHQQLGLQVITDDKCSKKNPSCLSLMIMSDTRSYFRVLNVIILHGTDKDLCML